MGGLYQYVGWGFGFRDISGLWQGGSGSEGGHGLACHRQEMHMAVGDTPSPRSPKTNGVRQAHSSLLAHLEGTLVIECS